MADKTMPERITVHQINNSKTFPDNARIAETGAGLLLPNNIEECEYVRADIAQGDSDEQLAAGQYRWLNIYGKWSACLITEVTRGEGNFIFLIPGYECGFSRSDRLVNKIGPVINPPANNAN